MEDIKESLDKAFNELNNNNLENNTSKEEIDELVNNQNKKVEEYRKELIEKIEKLKEYDINIEYDDNTSIEELENIINDVQF